MSGDPEPAKPPKLHRLGEIASRAASLNPRDPGLRRALYAGLAIMIVLAAALAVLSSVGELSDVEWRFRPLSFALGIAAIAIFLLLNAALWRHVLAALGPEVEPRTSRAIWFGSALGRFVPTSVLMPVLRMAAAERIGVPKRICLASVVYEMAIFLAGALVLSAYFVIDLPTLQDEPARFAAAALPILAVVALHPRFFGSFANRMLARLGRETLPVSLSMRRVLEFLVLYTLCFIPAGVGTYAIAQSLYPVGADDLIVVAGSFAVGTACSAIAFSLPGGLVAREAGMALALSPVMPAGPAIALAVLIRIIQMALEVLFTVTTPMMARSRASVAMVAASR